MVAYLFSKSRLTKGSCAVQPLRGEGRESVGENGAGCFFECARVDVTLKVKIYL